MSNRTPKGQQIDVIDRNLEYIQESFDLDRLDVFVTSLGVEYIHYKGIPSPIGQNDRGTYIKNDGVDTITSNGMIYTCAGKFTATMTGNTRDANFAESGILDPSESRLVMPRFYNENGEVANGKVIYLAPGDRIYVADPEADVMVPQPQKMDFVPNVDNIPMFPIAQLELPIVDSRNIQYKENVDFIITRDGNIRWIAGGKNPGIDPDTGKGRVYSIRYLYKAYWYITTLLKEVRVTNVTTNGQRKPERMPYHAIAVREYIYHNQNRGDQLNQNQSKDPKRVGAAPVEPKPRPNGITVDMSFIAEDES